MKQEAESSQLSYDALSEQVDCLSSNYIIVGSVARHATMQEVINLQRPDRSIRDIDVVDTTCTEQSSDVDPSMTFRTDASMTRTFRPIDELRWGLFLSKNDEPFVLIDGELCQPYKNVVLPETDILLSTFRGAVQAELIDITGPYYKNPEHAARFREWAQNNDRMLPQDTVQSFAKYRQARAELQAKSLLKRDDLNAKEKVITGAAAMYESLPLTYKKLIQRTLGTTIRNLRHNYKPGSAQAPQSTQNDGTELPFVRELLYNHFHIN